MMNRRTERLDQGLCPSRGPRNTPGGPHVCSNETLSNRGPQGQPVTALVLCGAERDSQPHRENEKWGGREEEG